MSSKTYEESGCFHNLKEVGWSENSNHFKTHQPLYSDSCLCGVQLAVLGGAFLGNYISEKVICLLFFNAFGFIMFLWVCSKEFPMAQLHVSYRIILEVTMSLK